MRARALYRDGEGFRPNRFEEDVEVEDIKVDGLKLATKVCDGSLHLVHSEISQILKENKGLFRVRPPALMPQIVPDSDIHGKRYIIYFDKKTGRSYLLGDVFSALKQLNGVIRF